MYTKKNYYCLAINVRLIEILCYIKHNLLPNYKQYFTNNCVSSIKEVARTNSQP